MAGDVPVDEGIDDRERMADSDIVVQVHDWVGEIALNRTSVYNALSTRLSIELAAAVALVSDIGVRALVLSSRSTVAFCVGADLKERGRLTEAEFMGQRLHFRRTFGSVLNLPIPTVAAVHGFALGGGYELALCCDLIVADVTAVVGLPEVTLGIVPGGGGTQLVARRAGYATAADLLLTGRRVGVEEAYRLRLVDQAVPAGMDRTAALELARTMAANSPVAVRNAKNALRRGMEVDLAAGLDIEDSAWRATVFSADRAEGVRAFLEKRPPHWPDG